MVFAIDPNELVHYIHAYTPVYEYEAYACDGSWFFAKSGDGYLGSWFSNGYEMTAYGANTEKELVSRGLNHAVIVKCGSKEEFGSFEAFQKSLKEMDCLLYTSSEYLRLVGDGPDEEEEAASGKAVHEAGDPGASRGAGTSFKGRWLKGASSPVGDLHTRGDNG